METFAIKYVEHRKQIIAKLMIIKSTNTHNRYEDNGVCCRVRTWPSLDIFQITTSSNTSIRFNKHNYNDQIMIEN